MRPECGFFFKSWEFEKGKEYYLNTWFHEVLPRHKAIGERSSLCIHGIKSAERIHSLYPDIKLIFCLRNPTERAYGNYRFTAMCGFETHSFEKSLKIEEIRKKRQKGIWKEIQPNLYRERGCYYDQLTPFFKLFPQEQILCIKSENMAKNTPETLKKVYDFLGVDSNFNAPKQENFSSPNVKGLYFQYLLRNMLGTKLDSITENFRKERTTSLIDRLVRLNLTEKKQPMSEYARKQLNEFYKPHNEKLANLLKWDLSDWI